MAVHKSIILKGGAKQTATGSNTTDKRVDAPLPFSYFGDLEPTLVVCRTEVSWSPKWWPRKARKLQDGTGIV